MNVKVDEVMSYKGHSLSANGNVNFSLKAEYSELVNTIKVMQMLNCDIVVKVKGHGIKPMKLGMFRLKQIVVDGDGESVIKLSSINDFVEMDNLNILPLQNDECNKFIVRFEAEIEEEDEGEV